MFGKSRPSFKSGDVVRPSKKVLLLGTVMSVKKRAHSDSDGSWYDCRVRWTTGVVQTLSESRLRRAV